jgi:serine/threonine protein kinase
LGDGGFADVWKATDELDRDVAVKIVRASGAVLSSALAHAKALARTNHPSIVSVISLDTVEDPDSGELVPGIVMELIAGVTLSTRLQGPKFSVDEARNLGVAIATAIAHIHAQGTLISYRSRLI